MNLHKYSQNELFNIRIRRGMKNWLSRKNPPADIRAKLLQAAVDDAEPKASLVERFLVIPVSSEYTYLTFERFAKATSYSLQIGVLIV